MKANNNNDILQFINDMFQHAADTSATDIHIEQFKECARIRIRIQGRLQKYMEISQSETQQLIASLKMAAHLDITEKRMPQDGRIEIDAPNMHIRINICATLYGEKVALRLFYPGQRDFNLKKLNLPPAQLTIILNALKKTSGIIFVVGPTGSGKTTTLYSMLNHLNGSNKNIMTLEDPVEIAFTGINQCNINTKIDITFSSLLTAILRQDPDVIMIGEIRDAATAKIAMQAAQTGHLVFATLHASNVFTCISRLKALQVSPQCIAQHTLLIISQRFIRLLCGHCKQEDPDSPTTYHPLGCPFCLLGYRDQMPVFEILPMSNKITAAIQNKLPLPALEQLALNESYLSLAHQVRQLLMQGKTSHEELQKVLCSN